MYKKKLLLIGIALCACLSVVTADEYKYTPPASGTGGSVTVTTSDNSTFTLTAIPTDGWVFTQWSDGETDNPYDYTPSGETPSIRATFEDHRVAVFDKSKTVDPSKGGTVSVTKSPTCDNEWTLTATPESGYTFLGWDDNGDGIVDAGNTSPRAITITEGQLSSDTLYYRAIFEDHRCVNYAPKYSTPVGGGGTVAATQPSGYCECVWKLTATPASGWAFKEWNDGNTSNPRDVTVNPDEEDKSYTATFVPACSLNVPVIASVTGLGSSSVTQPDPGCVCSWQLSVTAASGYTFMGWVDAPSASATRTVTSDDDDVDTYTPVFERTCVLNKPVVPSSPYYTATVEESATPCVWNVTITPIDGYTFIGWDDNGDGEPDPGTETQNPRTLPSGDTEPVTYTPIVPESCSVYEPTIGSAAGGTAAISSHPSACVWVLTATANTAECYSFVRWSDGNTDNPRTVDGSVATTYTPVFVQSTCNYSVPDVESDQGYVRAVIANECACDWTVTATPKSGWAFGHWSDLAPSDPDYTANPRTISSLDAETAAFTAVFEDHRATAFNKSKTEGPTQGGTVSATKSPTCDNEWILTAAPETDWTFAGWDDDGDGTVDAGNTSPRTITITSSQLSDDTLFYRAIFEDHRCTTYEAKVANPATGGTVTAVNGACECDWILTATPTEGYAFLQWEDCDYTNPRTVTVNPDAGTQTYTAHFLLSDAFIDSWTATDIVVGTKTQNLTPTDATIRINGVEVSSGVTPNPPANGDPGIWNVAQPGGGLNAYAGQPISIIFYDDGGMPVSVVNGTVPYISTGDKSFSGSSPAIPTNADVEVVDGTLTFDSDEPMVLGALTVHPDAKAVVPTGKEVTYTHIYMLGNGPEKKYPQLVANGTIHNLNSDTIYYDYKLNYASYYPLAVPYDVTCAKIRTKSGKAASYEVQWYNGEDRAANAHAWTVFDDQAVGATLRAGTGYIVFAVPYKWNGTRHATVDVRFPMVAPLTTAETEKSTPVSLYGGEWTSPSNKNWNLVGNPYLANYTTSDDARLMVGTYDPGLSTSGNEKYEYNNDGVRYVTMTTDGYQTYQQQRADEGVTIKAFTNFFIQSASTGDLVFTLSQRAQNAPRRKASRAESEELRELAFGIVLKAADQSDRTGLLYGEDFTDAYEMNADLVKMSGSTPVLELYSLVGNEKRAFNALHMTAIRTLVPLGYTNAPMGQMTIAFDYDHYDASSLEAVMLTDYETGRIVNLLDEDYSFTTTGTEENARFVINAVLAPRVTTDIGGTGVDGSSTNELDGVYDLLGRKVTLENLPQGVYIIIENGQSRKEVIQ